MFIDNLVKCETRGKRRAMGQIKRGFEHMRKGILVRRLEI